MKMQTRKRIVLFAMSFLALAGSPPVQAGDVTLRDSKDAKSVAIEQPDWREFAISPVSNPIFFEDPRIRTEARVIFLYNRVSDDFGLIIGGNEVNLGGADIYAYGAQLRYAITPRLAIIATNNVGISFRPDNPIPGTAFDDADGYSGINVGLKYALFDLPEHQFIFTPILTYATPTGNRRVFQADNSGIFDVAFSTEKGFDKFHLIGNAGVRIPVYGDRNSTSLHYSLHADYYVSPYFIPLIEMNGWTVLDSPSGLKGPLGGELDRQLGLPKGTVNTGLNTEGADLINFGASNLEGKTQFAVGAGFRSKLGKYVDFGVIAEKTLTEPEGAFDWRVTTDLIIHF